MKLFAWMMAALLAVATTASAAQMPPAPEILPMPDAVPPIEGAVVVSSAPVALFDCVRYKDLKNVHPCGVPLIVAVPDPCADRCDACGPQCVYVQVCVPPCDCYETKCKRNGRKTVLDFGKYQVEIVSARGQVVVDYDD